MIDLSQLTELEPDDPKVNPELFRRVQAAVQPLAIEELRTFDPIARDPSIAKQRRREMRLKVIEEYFKEQAAKHGGAPSKPAE